MKRLLIAIILLIPSIAVAQPQPGVDPCATIGGCSTNGSLIMSAAVQNLAALFVSVAAGASILFVVFGGFQMLVSFGNETNSTKGKNAVIFALSGFALTLGAQAIVSFVVNSAFSTGLQNSDANPALGLMSTAVMIMMNMFNIVFVVVAIAAGIRMVLGHGQSDEFTKARTALLYAVIGAVIINVARAMVNVILTAGF